MHLHKRIAIPTALLAVACGCTYEPRTEQPLKSKSDLFGEWQWIRVWQNGLDEHPSGQGMILSSDGIITQISNSFSDGVSYGRFLISNDLDSIHIMTGVKGVADLHAGIRFLNDTLLLTSYDNGDAFRIYMTKIDFAPVDTADGVLRFNVKHYSYSNDGATVTVVGSIVNDSEHDFRDVHGEFQVYDQPNGLKAILAGQVGTYNVNFPVVLAHAAFPYKRDIETPRFVRVKGQDLYGWEMIVYTKARGFVPDP